MSDVRVTRWPLRFAVLCVFVFFTILKTPFSSPLHTNLNINFSLPPSSVFKHETGDETCVRLRVRERRETRQTSPRKSEDGTPPPIPWLDFVSVETTRLSTHYALLRLRKLPQSVLHAPSALQLHPPATRGMFHKYTVTPLYGSRGSAHLLLTSAWRAWPWPPRPPPRQPRHRRSRDPA